MSNRKEGLLQPETGQFPFVHKVPATTHLIAVQRVLRRPRGDGNRIGLAAAVSLAVQILSIPGGAKKLLVPDAAELAASHWRSNEVHISLHECLLLPGCGQWLRHLAPSTGFLLGPVLSV